MGQDQSLELSKQEMTDLSFQLLVEFSFGALRTLVDAVGSERAIALNRPYWHHCGNAAAINLQKSLGLKVLDRNAFVEMFAFVNHVMRQEIELIGIEGEDWVEVHCHSCPAETGPPELCLLLTVLVDGMFEPFELNYDMIAIQTKTQGAPYCVYRMVPKGLKQERPQGREVILPAVQVPSISREEADSWAVQYIAEWWVMLTRAMMDYEGAEAALKAQLKSMKELGISLGLRLQRPNDRPEARIERVTSFLVYANQLFHQEGKPAVIDKECSEREIIICPFASAPPALCLQYEAFFNGICEAINPDYELAYDRMMTKGDHTCHWTLRNKKAIVKDKAKEEAASDDPVKRLTNKFIDGEITEEEFDKKMAHLRKHGLVK